jgi:hypothetical protein
MVYDGVAASHFAMLPRRALLRYADMPPLIFAAR